MGEVEIYLPLAGVIDLEAETARLQKSWTPSKELRRTEDKLTPASWQAPPEVVSWKKSAGKSICPGGASCRKGCAN